MRLHKQRKQALVLIGAGVLIVAAFIGTAVFLSKSPYELNASVKNTGLGLVLPAKLPVTATVTEQPSYDSKRGLISTTIRQDGKEIIISQQKKPDVDLKQIDAAETYLANAGSVYVLKGEKGRRQAIIETADSWVIVNADDSLSAAKFRYFIESMAPI